MLEVHPVLGMCVSDEFDVPYLIKGSKPEVIVKSDVDDVFINEFLIKAFDLYDSLCRFLVIERKFQLSVNKFKRLMILWWLMISLIPCWQIVMM